MGLVTFVQGVIRFVYVLKTQKTSINSTLLVVQDGNVCEMLQNIRTLSL